MSGGRRARQGALRPAPRRTVSRPVRALPALLPAMALLLAYALLLLPSLPAAGAGAAELVAAGNGSYARGQLAEAAAGYEKARQAAPEEAVPLYNLGVVLYRQDNLVAALSAFQSIPEAPFQLAARLHYNQGNTLARLGRLTREEQPEQALALYQRSLGAYRRALELDGGHGAAAMNLEIVRRWLAELESRLAEAQPGPGQSASGTPMPGSSGKPQEPPQNAPAPQDPVVQEPAPWELPDESAQAILREESARREEEQTRGGRWANDYPAW